MHTQYMSESVVNLHNFEFLHRALNWSHPEPGTVKTHANQAMLKFGARDRAQSVIFAYESGLIRLGWVT
jgi:hypothetical protein